MLHKFCVEEKTKPFIDVLLDSGDNIGISDQDFFDHLITIVGAV